MEIVNALLVGSLVGWVAPLFSRDPGLNPLVTMLVGALGGLLGVALNLLIHADTMLMVAFGAALLLAVVALRPGFRTPPHA